MKSSVVYVDIESLFDLRQGLLGSLDLDSDKVTDYLLSEEYNFRTTDQLKFVPQNAYREAMTDPDISLLETSTITRIFLSIKTKIDNIESRNKYYSETTIPEVLLNIYPFVMSPEQMDHIRDLLFCKLDKSVMVNVVRFLPKDVSPVFFKSSNVVGAFIYDVTGWLNSHLKSLEVTHVHDTIIYFPAVYAEEPNEAELKTITKLGFKDPISYTEYLLSTVATVNFLPTVFYSNIVTAVAHLNKFDGFLKTNLTKPEDEGKYDDLLSKIQVP